MKQKFRIDQYNNITNWHSFYGIPKADWWATFLDCHDKASWRGELVTMLEHAILTYHGKDPEKTILLSANKDGLGRDVGLFSKVDGSNHSMTADYSQYHRLVKQCEKHYCLPAGKIEKLPRLSPTEHAAWEERTNNRECEQRSKFYSRYRNSSA